MSLIGLPQEVWMNVLHSWLGNLRSIVRIDGALSVKDSSPLRVHYAGTSFSFPRDAQQDNADVLSGLCSWMRTRKVYFSCLGLDEKNQPLPPQWEELLSWSRESVKHFRYSNDCDETSNILLWASRYLNKLQNLDLNINHQPGSGVLEKLLQNNADTLVTLLLNAVDDGTCNWVDVGTSFLHLNMIGWTHRAGYNICDFLRLSPNLSALSVTRYDNETSDGSADSLLAVAIAECCPLLQKLELEGFDELLDADLSQIAGGCPLLQELVLWYCNSVSDNCLVEVVSALPCLHTLMSDEIVEETLLEIAERGKQLLRVLQTGTTFTFTGLRQLTAALPQLSELEIYNLELEAENNRASLLEYCVRLKRLEISSTQMEVDTLNAILESTAVHCHNLRTIVLPTHQPPNENALLAVIMQCPMLHTIRVGERNLGLALFHMFTTKR